MLEMPSLCGTHLPAAVLWWQSRVRIRSNTRKKSDGRSPGNLSPVGLHVTKLSMLKQCPHLHLQEKAPHRRWWVIRASSPLPGLRSVSAPLSGVPFSVHVSLVQFSIPGYRILEISAGMQPESAIVGCEKFYLCNEEFIFFLFCAASRLKTLWTKVPG